MRSYDLTPLFRSTVGFDGLFQLLDTAMKAEESAISYPPYNIEKTGEDSYRISMAVAGFSESEIAITAHGSSLLVTGKRARDENTEVKNFLYRGIATRSFERRFQLADHVQVLNASMQDGLLHIDLKREVPEAMRPRSITIEKGESTLVDGTKAH